MLLKHKVMSHQGCPIADTLSTTSRRTKTVLPWKVNLDLEFHFGFQGVHGYMTLCADILEALTVM